MKYKNIKGKNITEKIVNSLTSLSESIYSVEYKDYKVISINIEFDNIEDGNLLISGKSVKYFNVCGASYSPYIYFGCIVFDIGLVTLGKFKLDFLSEDSSFGNIKIMLGGLKEKVYHNVFIREFNRIDDNIYIVMFDGMNNDVVE